MIYTCSYKNFNTHLYKGISISGSSGKEVGYIGQCCSKLAPKKSFWDVWHNNIDKINELDNNKYYIKEYYNQVLSGLDPEKVYRDLDNSFLLCYEENDFCNRHIVAAWLELFLDVDIKEVTVENLHIKVIDKSPIIKEYLEQIIKEQINMRGFNSLRGLYLFEKGEEFEMRANILEQSTDKNFDNFRQAACYMRCEADMAEDKYKTKVLKR